MAKIAPKNAKEALIEALVMLDMVRRGETFAAQDWHDRFDLMRLHLTPNQREIVRAKVAAEIDGRRAGRTDATPRLYAAAPELLAALRALSVVVDQHIQSPTPMTLFALRQCQLNARAAIAAAEGR